MRTSCVGVFFVACLLADNNVPLYRITVVGRTAQAINYKHRSGPTKIGFQGTVLLPDARGEATVESKQGAIQVDAKFERLEAPTRYGTEYLTYVLWAITPEGRAVNLGQVVTNHADKARLKTATDLQAFGLVMTAEPYSAVTQPSDVVVMENVVLPGTSGSVEQIEAKYPLLSRGHYTFQAGSTAPDTGRKVSLNEYEALLELYQARNAVQIARSLGADRHAEASYRKAEQLLRQAEEAHAEKASTKNVVMAARQAAQTAEDARLITLKRLEEGQ